MPEQKHPGSGDPSYSTNFTAEAVPRRKSENSATLDHPCATRPSSHKLIGFGDCFLRPPDRDELIIHRFGATIPGLVEVRHRRALRFQLRSFVLRSVPGGGVRDP